MTPIEIAYDGIIISTTGAQPTTVHFQDQFWRNSEMISYEYNFENFLDSIKHKTIPEIQKETSREAERAEILSSSITKGISKRDKEIIGYYKKRVGEFAFFINTGIKPGSVDDKDFELYRPICEILVKRGEFLPSILECFK